TVRHSPTPLKFSSAKPSGSIWAWQTAQAAFARCCSIRSRIVGTFTFGGVSFSDGTSGGGGGGGVPRTFVSNHLPRIVGDVRLAYEVTVRMLPWPISPFRSS